jgi:hypothetical protein
LSLYYKLIQEPWKLENLLYESKIAKRKFEENLIPSIQEPTKDFRLTIVEARDSDESDYEEEFNEEEVSEEIKHEREASLIRQEQESDPEDQDEEYAGLNIIMKIMDLHMQSF